MVGVKSVIKEHFNLSNGAKVREKNKLKVHQTAELTASPTSMAFYGINSTAIQKR